MRQYNNFERYLNELMGDVYPQPPDPGHQKAIEDVVNKWLPVLQGLRSVLDVGCGQGQAIESIKEYAPVVDGVTLGDDIIIARNNGHEIYADDMSFLTAADKSYDLIFARHVLEHSPMPLLTLMEWHRVARQWLCLIVPNLQAFGPGGRNHYYVLEPGQWDNILDRAGWHIIWKDEYALPRTSEDELNSNPKPIPMEYRFMCEKKRRITP